MGIGLQPRGLDRFLAVHAEPVAAVLDPVQRLADEREFAPRLVAERVEHLGVLHLGGPLGGIRMESGETVLLDAVEPGLQEVFLLLQRLPRCRYLLFAEHVAWRVHNGSRIDPGPAIERIAARVPLAGLPADRLVSFRLKLSAGPLDR